MNHTKWLLISGLGLVFGLAAWSESRAADEAKPAAPAAKADEAPAAPDAAARALAAKRRDSIDKAVKFILSKQNSSGSWGWFGGGVGETVLSTRALLFAGKTSKDETVKKALDWIVKAQKSDGSIQDNGGFSNYMTCIAVQALAKANDPVYAEALKKAVDYLKLHQWDDAETADKKEKVDKDSPKFGGAGYGLAARPDLSNTQYFAEALHAAGVPKDDPAWARMAVFVSRCQARSESNDSATTKVVTTDDGGFIYSPVGGGETKAGKADLPGGGKGLRSYGSMTYAGFKSMLYASVSKDDPRVKAAMEWIQKHWGFEENPELGQQGYYYYCQTAAKALKAYGDDKILDARKRPHEWRAEITESLLKRQKDDGSWTNPSDRWLEGNPLIPTSYSVVALADCE